MEDFSPEKDRLKQARDTATLARLRAGAAAPGAADRLAAAAGKEPDPTAIHRGLLRKNFPELPFIHGGWARGLPNLRDLANLATLRSHFSSKKKQPAPSGRASEAQQAEAFAAFAKRFGRPRSPWSRLAFWRRP